ncbi:uncharacterized protein G2W53_018750 [Senna tora]|uniref:Uncharacterized protein n=1 Tax=Senna tora TaxID=362788 RepID=A0A834WQ40_9FABA|nr:uncharacterized protein G2W53_018750 [Senna tora]
MTMIILKELSTVHQIAAVTRESSKRERPRVQVSTNLEELEISKAVQGRKTAILFSKRFRRIILMNAMVIQRE